MFFFFHLVKQRNENVNRINFFSSLLQILIATRNRIMGLENNSFKSYASITHLYLANNTIGLDGIQEDAFAPLQSLEKLDLTYNRLKSLPKSLLSLPLLTTLLLANNQLTNAIFSSAKLISSPLVTLNMANNQLDRMPELGIIPTLTHMNLSDNILIKEISIEKIVPYCSLKKLDFSNINLTFGKADCECHHWKTWIELRQIVVLPKIGSCDQADNSCVALHQFSNNSMALYNSCEKNIGLIERNKSTRVKWVKSFIFIIASLMAIFVTFYCIHCCKIKRGKPKGDDGFCSECLLDCVNAVFW